MESRFSTALTSAGTSEPRSRDAALRRHGGGPHGLRRGPHKELTHAPPHGAGRLAHRARRLAPQRCLAFGHWFGGLQDSQPLRSSARTSGMASNISQVPSQPKSSRAFAPAKYLAAAALEALIVEGPFFFYDKIFSNMLPVTSAPRQVCVQTLAPGRDPGDRAAD